MQFLLFETECSMLYTLSLAFIVVSVLFVIVENKIKTCVKKNTSIQFNNKIRSGTVRSWNGALQIPPVYSSSLAYCKIVLIEYFICLAIKPSFLTRSKYLNIPIEIGTQAINDKKVTMSNLTSKI